jgi:hypothetical protein
MEPCRVEDSAALRPRAGGQTSQQKRLVQRQFPITPNRLRRNEGMLVCLSRLEEPSQARSMKIAAADAQALISARGIFDLIAVRDHPFGIMVLLVQRTEQRA